jgi:hypothetical protein
MLWLMAAILVVLWGVGLMTSFTLGGFIHVFLALAAVVVLIRVIRRQKLLQ